MLTRTLLVLLCLALACGGDDRPRRDTGPRDVGADVTTEGDIGVDAPFVRDGGNPDAPFDPDAACASATVMAEVENAPVDIVWVVDNSTSMEPAIRNVQLGLNDFAMRVARSGLDYRVIMLSLRGTSADSRYPICIPPPLAGDSACGDGERFFHVNVDIKSTQPVEQILGTLGQTAGYTVESVDRGSLPWRMLLRDDATKTVVVATDDNSRTCLHPHTTGVVCHASDPPLTATSLEDFPGGGNPFNSNVLGPGLRSAAYGSLFEGYTFNAIYGWGSAADPDALCTYPDGSSPDSPGYTYTELVNRTGGVRAQICQQASSAAWNDFFEAIATRVEETARIACELALPAPPAGMTLDPRKVNVFLEAEGDSSLFRKVADESSCGPLGGWYYDDEAAPTQVLLCPASCEQAQDVLSEAGTASVGVQFGCDSLLI